MYAVIAAYYAESLKVITLHEAYIRSEKPLFWGTYAQCIDWANKNANQYI